MSYYLFALFIVASISIILACYYKWTQDDILSDVATIDLSGDDNPLLTPWYNAHLHLNDIVINNHNNGDNYAIAARFLARLHGLRINKEELVIGENLQGQYHKISGRVLIPSNWFDIRSVLGIKGEIAIINNAIHRDHLRRTNTLDMHEIAAIMNANLDKAARDFVSDILRQRWDTLTQLGHPDLVMDERLSKSYAYFTAEDGIIGGIPNIIGMVTDNTIRINLLTDEISFRTFIQRYRKEAELALNRGELSYRYQLPGSNIYANV